MADEVTDLFLEIGVLEEDCSVEDELDAFAVRGDVLGTGDGIAGERLGSLIENGGCDGILPGLSGLEDGDRNGGEFGFGRHEGPVDEVLRFIHLEVGEDVRAEGRPGVVSVRIVGRDERAESPLCDIAGACAVTKNVSSSTHAGAGAIAVAAEAAGAGSAEDEDLDRAVRSPIDGFDSGDEVI